MNLQMGFNLLSKLAISFRQWGKSADTSKTPRHVTFEGELPSAASILEKVKESLIS